MAQPPPYVRAHNFSDFSASNPNDQQSGVWLDDELNAVKQTTDALNANIALLQKDDGTLFNGIVTYDSLSAATKALLGSTMTPRGDWVTAHSYVALDLVTHSGATYVCVTAHTSGTFATDLAAFKWILFAGSSSSGDMSTLDFSTITEDTTPDLSADYVLTRDTSAAANKKVKPVNLLSGITSFYVATVGGTANAITLTPSTAIAAYTAGQRFRFVVGSDNTSGTVTAAVSGLTAKNVNKVIGKTIVALGVGDLPAGSLADIEYDGTQFELMNVRPYSQGASISASATTDLTGSTGDYLHITGTTTITAVTLEQGQQRTLVFDGILTLTNGTSLILPSGANITTAVGDMCTIRGEASAVVRCVSYTRANGTALAIGTSSVNAGSLTGSVLAAGVTASSIITLGSLTDIATNNVSTSAHGFAPKAPNDATKYLDGTGNYSTPTAVTAGLTQIETLSPSGVASHDFTGIPTTYRSIILSWSGISNVSASRIFQLAFNCGSGFGSEIMRYTQINGTTVSAAIDAAIPFVGTTLTAAQTTSGRIEFNGYQSGPYKTFTGYYFDSNSQQITFSGIITSSTGALQGIRAYWNSTGNFDAGSITLYGVN